MGLFSRHKSYVTKEGYKQIYKPDHPSARSNGYVGEHVYKATKKYGRVPNNNEVVHHRDGNKLNNRKRNLEIMTKSDHYNHHHFK